MFTEAAYPMLASLIGHLRRNRSQNRRPERVAVEQVCSQESGHDKKAEAQVGQGELGQ
jgi:hypothetical protein